MPRIILFLPTATVLEKLPEPPQISLDPKIFNQSISWTRLISELISVCTLLVSPEAGREAEAQKIQEDHVLLTQLLVDYMALALAMLPPDGLDCFGTEDPDTGSMKMSHDDTTKLREIGREGCRAYASVMDIIFSQELAGDRFSQIVAPVWMKRGRDLCGCRCGIPGGYHILDILSVTTDVVDSCKVPEFVFDIRQSAEKMAHTLEVDCLGEQHSTKH